MAIMTYDERLKEQEKNNKSKLDEQLKTSDSNFEAQKSQVTSTINKEIDDTKSSYDDLYQENAVQKIVNEREISENMANLGLTDSGLNRTQQTAVQLSYANNKNKLDVSRQKAVDNLTAQLAEKISQIDISKSQAAQNIRDTWNQQNSTNALNLYNADVEAETDRYEAEQEQIAATNKAEQERIATTNKALIEAGTAKYKADTEAETARYKAYYSAQQKILTEQAKAEKENSYIIKANGATLSYDFQGSLKDNGVTVIYGNDGKTTYVDTKSGKKTVMDSTINPYTGTRNKDVNNGVFSNGYQPNNIGNKKLKEVKGARININGRSQRIFTYDDKSYYYWDGKHNKYEKLTTEEKKSLGIK